jgi:hypothetical protein
MQDPIVKFNKGIFKSINRIINIIKEVTITIMHLNKTT